MRGSVVTDEVERDAVSSWICAPFYTSISSFVTRDADVARQPAEVNVIVSYSE